MNKPLNPVVASVLVSAFLQPAVDRFVQTAAERGYARLDMGILSDPKNSKSDVIEPALLSRFRTVAESIDPELRATKVRDLVQFIQAALPTLQMPKVSFIDYPARTGKPRLNEATGELEPTTLKATTASFFGTPPSSLSKAAQETNARLKAELDSLLATTVTASAVETPAAIV